MKDHSYRMPLHMAHTKDHNYRNKPVPVPFHAMCNAMAVSMHAEIVALYSLLKDQIGWADRHVQEIDKLVAERLKEQEEA